MNHVTWKKNFSFKKYIIYGKNLMTTSKTNDDYDYHLYLIPSVHTISDYKQMQAW